MIDKLTVRFVAVLFACVFTSLLLPRDMYAVTYYVDPARKGGCLTTAPLPCYTTIQAAIDAADVAKTNNPDLNYDILVEPGTYAGGISLKSSIPLRGRETARTILDGGGAGTLITANAVSSLSVRNFTFRNASIGIDVSNNATPSITNNVFFLGTGGTAVRILVAPSVTVENNTFYSNGIGVSRDAESVKINNNIFSNNTTHISQSTLVVTENNITYNLFHPTASEPNGTNFIPNETITQSDPLFVDINALDFHIKLNSPASPAIDTGDNTIFDTWQSPANPSDRGAYGGPNADSIPFRIPKPTPTNVAGTTIDLQWTPNNSYLTGGYKVHYSLNASGPPYTTVDLGTAATASLTGLDDAPTAPAAPVLQSVGYANGTLSPQWTAVANATGYKVYYRDTVTAAENFIDVGNKLSHDITGLINDRDYDITVTAYTQNTYYISVTTYDSVAGATREPGVQHESAYSEELTVALGNPAESIRSNSITEYPELIIGYPGLPNTGCFVATAAYGYYSAPQVQVLRDFRDQYLLTNGPGRVFVRWYYAVGPVGARFLNEHSWLKPPVRVALLPAVGGAYFMTRTPASIQVVALAALMLIGIWFFRRVKGQSPLEQEGDSPSAKQKGNLI